MLKKSDIKSVKRKQVYAGEVISREFGFIRGMLFIVNDKGEACDIIYSSPNYSIFELQTPAQYKDPIYIKHAVNLEEALKYMGYPEELDRGDIYSIYKELITSNKWLKENVDLFDISNDNSLPYFIYENLSWVNLEPNGRPTKEELMIASK